MDLRIVVSLLMSTLLVGCGGNQILRTLDYPPSSTMAVSGNVKVGDFVYLPGNPGGSVDPNQIDNTALGDLVFEKNIDQYFESALMAEADFVGLNLDGAQATISGEILEFIADDLGYSVDWKLNVKYVLNSADGNECYNSVKKVERNTEKNPLTAEARMFETMKLSFEQLFGDENFKNCVAG